jgi:threonine dehydrogenase-like Zn-dependent dehydrogenase
MRYRMRLLAEQYRQLRDLLGDETREQAAFLVCAQARAADAALLLVREILPLASDDLRVQAADQLSVAPAAMLRAARRAAALEGSVCMVHTHPGARGAVGFSRADDWGNRRTFEFFCGQLPGRPHSCLVFSGDLRCVAGRVHESAEQWSELDEVVVLDETRRMVVPPVAAAAGLVGERFDRQARLLGAAGQRALHSVRVAVVGCGGIGSVVAALLAHSGARDILLVDPDAIEESNLPRLLGACVADVAAKRRKVDMLGDYVESHSPGIAVCRVPKCVEDPELLPLLARAGAIFCGTDDTTSRAYLNQLCHQYYVPVIDLGVQFGVDRSSGRLSSETGRVNLMVPGTACLCCTGQIDGLRLNHEAESAQARGLLAEAGYLAGADEPEPAMMAFNMQVAARGVQRFVQWVTGVCEEQAQWMEDFRFFGLAGDHGITRRARRRQDGCAVCGSGSLLKGAGDSMAMLVGPRPKFRRVA